MTNALTPVSFANLPSVQMGSDEDFAALAKGANFLGRMQLYSGKSKVVSKNIIRAGHYGIPVAEDEVIDLGSSVDVLVLARRPKALDMSDLEAIVTSYERDSDEFKRIQAKSEEPNSSCQWGISFLVYERNSGRFLELFCGSATMRREASKMFDFMMLTEDDIKRKEEAGKDVSKLTPHGPLPMTLKSRYIEKGSFSWHGPTVFPCSTPIKLPEEAVVVAEITKFLTAKNGGVEKVADTKKSSRVR